MNVVRVFTNEAGEFGNLLGIVDGSAVPPDERQRVAAAIGFSETVFIDDRLAGRVRTRSPTDSGRGSRTLTLPSSWTSGQHYVWAWVDETAGILRSRMFAPTMGIVEDEATGAAAIALTALQRRDLDITQGRGSRIHTKWDRDGWARIGGRVVGEPPRTNP